MNGTASVGTPIDAYASVENTGEATPVDTAVRFAIDGVGLGDGVAPAGWTGIIAVASPQKWEPTAGWHTLRVEVDANGQVTETDEANNVLTWDFFVEDPSSRPDLWVSEVRFRSSIEEGQWSDAEAVVENTGAPTTAPFWVNLWVDDGQIGGAEVPAGFTGTTTVVSSIGWTSRAGQHTLLAIADFTGAIDETDEENNQLAVPFEVAGVARELIVSWSWYPGYYNVVEWPIVHTTSYRGVWYDLKCGDATTLEVFLDDVLMATCANGVRTATYPDTMAAGSHRFTIVYLGVGPATLEVTGLPTGAA